MAKTFWGQVTYFERYLINISLLFQEFKMEEVWIKEEPCSTDMIQIHEGKNSVECSRCDFTTKFKHVLNKHFLEVHDRKNQDHDSSPDIKSEPIDELPDFATSIPSRCMVP